MLRDLDLEVEDGVRVACSQSTLIQYHKSAFVTCLLCTELQFVSHFPSD
jgi:hypothetical protein